MTRSKAMRQLLARWRESGMSLMAFGRQERVAYSRLLYWKKKFEHEARGEVQADLVPIDVVACKVPTTTASPATVEVRLPNGIGLDVVPGFDAQELRRLVSVLQSC